MTAVNHYNYIWRAIWIFQQKIALNPIHSRNLHSFMLLIMMSSLHCSTDAVAATVETESESSNMAHERDSHQRIIDWPTGSVVSISNFSV